MRFRDAHATQDNILSRLNLLADLGGSSNSHELIAQSRFQETRLILTMTQRDMTGVCVVF